MTEITQADRDAAAEAFFCKPLLNEKHNDDRRVRAFARHREQAIEALQEQHEAFKQEVSDAVEVVVEVFKHEVEFPALERFIIPKPVDPLVEAWIEATGNTVGMEPLNEALAKRGLKIVDNA